MQFHNQHTTNTCVPQVQMMLVHSKLALMSNKYTELFIVSNNRSNSLITAL